MNQESSPSIRLLLAILVVILSLNPILQARADEEKSNSGGESRPSLGIGIPESNSTVASGLDVSSSGKVLFSLALILGGYGLFAKYRGTRMSGGIPSELSIASKIMLTPRTTLFLVNVRDRSILCAVGSEQVSIIPTDSPVTIPFNDLLENQEALDNEKLPETELNPPSSERSVK